MGRIQVDELCSECRNVTWNGSRLEVMINVINRDERYRDKSDDEVNSTIFMMLTQCMSKLTCKECRLMLLKRLPGMRYGGQ
jgi:hypothetical protein